MGVKVTCCNCDGEFDERDLRGTWLDRRCPLCDGRVSERAYDQAAADVLRRHRPQLGKRGRRRLDRLALSRYYTSEWFRLACAGQGSEAADKGLFGLHAGYDEKNGAFFLIPADGDRSPDGGWGVSGEYCVFDALRAEIEREDSPLHDALLVPSLVFPWLPGQKPKQWGARHKAETDCVLLCESCAVIVEVKRRGHHVRASKGFGNVRERTEGGSFHTASDALEQVERGADSFAERQQLYSPRDIYKMVVYVDALSFECADESFCDHLLVSWVDRDGNAHFLDALRSLVAGLDLIADGQRVHDVAKRLFDGFGNTSGRRDGRIVRGQGAPFGAKLRRTASLLQAIERMADDVRSPLCGSRLLKSLVCEVQVGRRDGKERFKQVNVAGLLLTRTHAVFIDARRWPVHVNTHVPFATVYTGDPEDGAAAVDEAIRHDWNLEAIHYRNRSGSLTLLNFAVKSLEEVDRYRERNRVCTMNVFVDPVTFFSDNDMFRQKTFIGYWKGWNANNVLAALEQLVESAEPIMTQSELDKLARRIAAIRV